MVFCSISFIVPVYNAVNYVGECIESILHQTISDFEVLLVDDGSLDGSGLICDKYAEQDERVHVIHTENHGVSHARNMAIALARGKYIVFVDADDLICPYVAEKIIRGFQVHENVEMVCWKYEKIAESKDFLYKNVTKSDEPIKISEIPEVLWQVVTDSQVAGYIWNKAFLKSVIDRQKICFQEDIAVMEDLLFTCEYLKHCKPDSRVLLLSDGMYGYRQTETSVLHATFSEKKLTSLLVRDQVFEILAEAELDFEKVNQFRNQLLRALCVMNKKLIGYRGKNRSYWQNIVDALWKKHSSQCDYDNTWSFKEKCYRMVLQFTFGFRMKGKE